jgi:hypothetical protein
MLLIKKNIFDKLLTNQKNKNNIEIITGKNCFKIKIYDFNTVFKTVLNIHTLMG